MTEKELRRLSRKELLQMMLLQAEENERLKAELAKRQQIQIKTDRAGSIAEAAMEVHKVFESAQAAANTYLENIRKMHAYQKAYCEGMIKRANQEAATIIRKAKESSANET